jgi:DNA polymerase-1
MAAIEPRVLAYYSQDPALFQIISTGQDFHGYNTKLFFGLECDVSEVKKNFPLEREVGKEVALALMYGAGSSRLQESAQKRGFHWSKSQCREKLEGFKEFYSDVYDFKRELDYGLASGQAVSNLMGRKFSFPDPSDIHMKGLNTLIQSSASDLVLESAARIMNAFRNADIDGHVLLLIHDELVIELPKEKESQGVAIIEHNMTSYPLKTPHGLVPLAVEGKTAGTWQK